MSPVVEIKPAPDGDGFCLHLGKASPIWFATEHAAVGYARDVSPGSEIIVFEGEGIIRRRYPPVNAQ
jgi:hypothetical protein